jgi:hypothetical protein
MYRCNVAIRRDTRYPCAVDKQKSLLKRIISMRLSSEDGAALDRVAELVPAVPRLTLARMALRIGLEEIRKRPTRALSADR